MAKISETETVIKKIIPYLVRRGYDVDKDFTFEFPSPGSTRASLGFVDILVRHAGKIGFLVEAKRIAKTLSKKDREQAIEYGLALKAPFVVLTNGVQFESYNSATGRRIRWNGLSDRIPGKKELGQALTALRKDLAATEITLNDSSLPFRPGLPLKQLNALFSRCHGTIRKIEKNEDYAFTDFAKLLFLKLLEEKSDGEDFVLPYSYRFHELAEIPASSADQVKDAAIAMLDAVRRRTSYGDVIRENIHLKNSRTFQKIVQELAAVSFRDSRTDTKGAAFEYFVRATLKGKNLGQYFTPRPLIELMQAMVGQDKILSTLSFNGSVRAVDPACGTGGFLVSFMLTAIDQANQLYSTGRINASRRDELIDKLRKEVFFGADAHEGVASSAKMNMIIAGDGHSNIRCEDTLASSSKIWNVEQADIDLIITNPPFGTSESESMADGDLTQFPVKGAKGQNLFLQKMIRSTKPGGEVCTVIDEGLLNTDQGKDLRAFILQETKIIGIVRLSDSTFRPNKINVKASVLHLQKREVANPDMDDVYPVLFLDLRTLGYHSSGEVIRNLNFHSVVANLATEYHGDARQNIGRFGDSEYWRWFTRSSLDLSKDPTVRFDFKYWNNEITLRLDELIKDKASTLKQLNQVSTRRGKSPNSALYVDEEDGHALVIKAGTNIGRNGAVITSGDYIEKSVYDEMKSVHVEDGDVLLSSTGEGTLGKCAVYRGKLPAIFDGHVTLIRVDQKKVYPEYLCDYLRAGFGATQISRLFTGSTGLIELPQHLVDRIMIKLPSLSEQKKLSNALRAAEKAHAASLMTADALLEEASELFEEH